MNNLHNIVLSNLELNYFFNWNSDLGFQHDCDDDLVYIGWIQEYNFIRGYGYVADLINNEKHFFHYSEIGEDLYSCDHISIKKIVLDYILFQIKSQFRETDEWKTLKKELGEKNIDNIEISKKNRFGSYKILVSNNKGNVEISQYNFSGYPFISPAQIVCFKIQEGKVIGIHNPFYYKYHLLKNRDKYSPTIWNLLFNYVPSLLYSIDYKGIDNLEKELFSFREKAKQYIKQIKQFDIRPYKELNNYNLKLKTSYHPTVKDSDPNKLYLEILRKKELEDEFVTHSTIQIPLTKTVFCYGQATMDYLQYYINDEYKKEFNSFYEEYKNCRKSQNFDYTALIEKHFQPLKKKWIDCFISKYSESEHLKFYLRKLKCEYIKNLKEICRFDVNKIKPLFFNNDDYVFSFEKSLPHYGYKVEIIHTNCNYKLYTYDDRYNGYFKGKHFIGQMYFGNMDSDYNKIDIIKINNELYSFIDSQFEIVIEDCVKELHI